MTRLWLLYPRRGGRGVRFSLWNACSFMAPNRTTDSLPEQTLTPLPEAMYFADAPSQGDRQLRNNVFLKRYRLTGQLLRLAASGAFPCFGPTENVLAERAQGPVPHNPLTSNQHPPTVATLPVIGNIRHCNGLERRPDRKSPIPRQSQPNPGHPPTQSQSIPSQSQSIPDTHQTSVNRGVNPGHPPNERQSWSQSQSIPSQSRTPTKRASIVESIPVNPESIPDTHHRTRPTRGEQDARRPRGGPMRPRIAWVSNFER